MIPYVLGSRSSLPCDITTNSKRRDTTTHARQLKNYVRPVRLYVRLEARGRGPCREQFEFREITYLQMRDVNIVYRVYREM